MFTAKKWICFVMAAVLVCTLAVGCTDKQTQIKEVKDGLSAYELAVQYGYEGTIEQWLDSLNGKSRITEKV